MASVKKTDRKYIQEVQLLDKHLQEIGLSNPREPSDDGLPKESVKREFVLQHYSNNRSNRSQSPDRHRSLELAYRPASPPNSISLSVGPSPSPSPSPFSPSYPYNHYNYKSSSMATVFGGRKPLISPSKLSATLNCLNAPLRQQSHHQHQLYQNPGFSTYGGYGVFYGTNMMLPTSSQSPYPSQFNYNTGLPLPLPLSRSSSQSSGFVSVSQDQHDSSASQTPTPPQSGFSLSPSLYNEQLMYNPLFSMNSKSNYMHRDRRAQHDEYFKLYGDRSSQSDESDHDRSQESQDYRRIRNKRMPSKSKSGQKTRTIRNLCGSSDSKKKGWSWKAGGLTEDNVNVFSDEEDFSPNLRRKGDKGKSNRRNDSGHSSLTSKSKFTNMNSEDLDPSTPTTTDSKRGSWRSLFRLLYHILVRCFLFINVLLIFCVFFAAKWPHPLDAMVFRVTDFYTNVFEYILDALQKLQDVCNPVLEFIYPTETNLTNEDAIDILVALH